MTITGSEFFNLTQLKQVIKKKEDQFFSPINVRPIGSIYISVNSTSPSLLFGGTWEEIQGRFLFARNNIYPSGEIGGEENHILTIKEMPSHRHHVGTLQWLQLGDSENMYTNGWVMSSTVTGLTGGDQPHNNMPPYLTVYMWKRIA